MKTGTKFRRLAVAAVLLASCVPALCAIEPPGKEYRISGVVVSAKDGAPVPFCRITAFALGNPEATTGGNGGSPSQRPGTAQPGGGRVGGGPAPAKPAGGGGSEAIADGSGKFSIDLPRAGSWRLSATARGFRAQNYDEHEGFYSAVVLSEAEPAFAVRFRLTPDSVLTGFILDDSGEPVAMAQVSAELVPVAAQGEVSGALLRPRQVGGVQTDDRGRYEIGGLTPGQYRLRVQAQPWYSAGSRGTPAFRPGLTAAQNSTPPPDPSLDFVYPVTWYPGVDDESAAELIMVSLGEDRQADFRLTAIPSVHLRVPRPDIPAVTSPNDQRNRPQQQRMVSIIRVGGGGPGMMQMMPMSTSGSDWDFGGLAPGTYEVRIPGPDGRSSEVRRIEVKPGSSTVLTMDGANPLIRVQLELDGIPNSQAMTFEFVDTETGERISSASNFRGRGGPQRDDQGEVVDAPDEAEASNRVVMLEPHTYTINVTSGPAAYLTGIAAEGAKVAGRVVTISGPATITMHLATKHAQLDGVAQLGGQPAAGAMVLLVPATFGTAGSLTDIQRAETNTDGSFRLSAVTPGQYILVAVDHGWNVDWRNPATLGQYLLRGTPVNLQPDTKDHKVIEAASTN